MYPLSPQCRVGDTLSVRVGGDFIYDPAQSWSHDLLLIGGGVGINPLFSMLLHHTRLVEQGRLSGKVKLLYSARNTTELLFKVTPLALTIDHGDVTVTSPRRPLMSCVLSIPHGSGPHIS